MLVRSIFLNYFRLLAGVSLAFIAVGLAGCTDTAAEKAVPTRPVLVATVHYEAESPERSFVGTIKPRIETDMGFRVPGRSRNAWWKSARRSTSVSRWQPSMKS